MPIMQKTKLTAKEKLFLFFKKKNGLENHYYSSKVYNQMTLYTRSILKDCKQLIKLGYLECLSHNHFDICDKKAFHGCIITVTDKF